MDYSRLGPKTGYVVGYVGPMFGEKTTALLSDLKKFEIAKRKVLLFKPDIENRFGNKTVGSHNGLTREAISVPLDHPEYIYRTVDETIDVIGVDEIQFFSEEIVDVVRTLSHYQGKFVIFAGLDNNFRREPFGSMPLLLTLANEVVKKHAVCMCCGAPASWTQRIIDGVPAHVNDPTIVVGAKEAYEARCGDCHKLRTD